MTDAEALAPTDTSAPPAAHRWSPVLAMALATFTVVSAEMMPVGLLTPMSHSLGVSDGVTGLSLTITGLIAAVLSPFAPMLVGLRDRRTVLVAFMLLLGLANALTALAPDFAVLALGRVLLGAAMGIVWGLAAGLGPRLADRSRLPLAMTLIFSGVSVASVLGVPLGTYLAALLDWRAAFWALALLAVASAAVLAATLPALPVHGRGRPGSLAGALRHRGVAVGLAITAFVVLGHFVGYTYVRPVLETDAGLGNGVIAACLLVYGLAGVAGNFTLGPLSGRRPRTAVLLALAGVTLAAALLPYATGGLATVLLVLVVWGASYGGVSVSTQTWVRTADPARIEASAAVWAGVFNASIAVGSLAGGLVVDHAGTHAVLGTAAALTAAGLLLAARSRPGAGRRG
ncbi:MFS transporter [Streptomyces sp. 1331.2]|uniref:MFS transporter n=1 Tax=Streptomyces sp. 1331.2 TaxID=1938835 RepID=UPI000BC6120F|nr:MFS transporter [Streptomyces sp. 1331.2]SOB79346.1 Predicted arabinose efflux permease, MFS family [Streptomyces sp. 1331.2]